MSLFRQQRRQQLIKHPMKRLVSRREKTDFAVVIGSASFIKLFFHIENINNINLADRHARFIFISNKTVDIIAGKQSEGKVQNTRNFKEGIAKFPVYTSRRAGEIEYIPAEVIVAAFIESYPRHRNCRRRNNNSPYAGD